MSICISSVAGACANTAGQNSHRYLSVAGFAKGSFSSAFPGKVNGTGRAKAKCTLFIQTAVSASSANTHETFITDFGADEKRKESVHYLFV